MQRSVWRSGISAYSFIYSLINYDSQKEVHKSSWCISWDIKHFKRKIWEQSNSCTQTGGHDPPVWITLLIPLRGGGKGQKQQCDPQDCMANRGQGGAFSYFHRAQATAGSRWCREPHASVGLPKDWIFKTTYCKPPPRKRKCFVMALFEDSKPLWALCRTAQGSSHPLATTAACTEWK